MGLGSLLAISILANSAQLFGPANVDPEIPGSAALEAAIPFGKIGTASWRCSECSSPSPARRSKPAWPMLIRSRNSSAGRGAGTRSRGRRRGSRSPGSCCSSPRSAIVLTGVDVMTLVEFAVLFSILVLPLTYLPLLLLSGDRKYMGQYVNGPVGEDAWAGSIFAIITAAAIAALPLYFLTSGGNG